MRKNKKVLLIEPNYSNKYPPIGLMKIASYYKMIGGWDVTFFKGDLKQFVIESIADKCIEELSIIDDSIDWFLRKEAITRFIQTRKLVDLESIKLEESELDLLLYSRIEYYKDYWWKGEWKKHPQWDRVGVTTLFTFYWDITVETINFAKNLVKKKKDLMVGGVLASIQPKELEAATGIKPHVGILRPGDLDKDNNLFIDNLPLDYSILDEIDYEYPMNNAFYGYTSRGCIRHCAFCAVPTLEPEYNAYIPLKERIELIRERFGDQKDLLLMDNNVLASKDLSKIIDDIVDCGFGKGAKFVQPNLFELAIKNLKDGINDRAYVRKAFKLIDSLCKKLKGEEQYQLYKILDNFHLRKFSTVRKEALLEAYDEIKDIYNKHFRPVPKLRYIDFNQGVDARLFTPEIVAQLSKIAIRPLRIAFDDIKTRPAYENAIKLSASANLREFSNYLLYNFKDKPIDLYDRLKINVQMCEDLDVNIYSFPMKYHPIRRTSDDGDDMSHNRDYIGVHWNRKYIRAIQAILNSTKGKVGRGMSFFNEAFGETQDEYLELLEMPETFILYRFFFKWLDTKANIGTNHWRICWKKCKESLDDSAWNHLLDIIHRNTFKEEELDSVTSELGKELLKFYTNYRKDIITEGTELFNFKQEYDLNPTKELRRKRT